MEIAVRPDVFVAIRYHVAGIGVRPGLAPLPRRKQPWRQQRNRRPRVDRGFRNLIAACGHARWSLVFDAAMLLVLVATEQSTPPLVPTSWRVGVCCFLLVYNLVNFLKLLQDAYKAAVQGNQGNAPAAAVAAHRAGVVPPAPPVVAVEGRPAQDRRRPRRVAPLAQLEQKPVAQNQRWKRMQLRRHLDTKVKMLLAPLLEHLCPNDRAANEAVYVRLVLAHVGRRRCPCLQRNRRMPSSRTAGDRARVVAWFWGTMCLLVSMYFHDAPSACGTSLRWQVHDVVC